MTRHFAGAQLGCLHLAGGKVDSGAGMQIQKWGGGHMQHRNLGLAREILKHLVLMLTVFLSVAGYS